MPQLLGFASGSAAPATGGDWPSWLPVLSAAVASAWLVSLLVVLCGNRSAAKKIAADDAQKKQAKQAKVKPASAKPAAASSSKTSARSSGGGADVPGLDILAGPHPVHQLAVAVVPAAAAAAEVAVGEAASPARETYDQRQQLHGVAVAVLEAGANTAAERLGPVKIIVGVRCIHRSGLI